jgi:hypothetical protein
MPWSWGDAGCGQKAKPAVYHNVPSSVHWIQTTAGLQTTSAPTQTTVAIVTSQPTATQPSTQTHQLRGILINNELGPQLFDPEHAPFTSDDVDLLPWGPTQAVMLGDIAYVMTLNGGPMSIYDTRTNLVHASTATQNEQHG